MQKAIFFRLKRMWPPNAPPEEQFDLYEAIKNGDKKIEYRDLTEYWTNTLFQKGAPPWEQKLRSRRAWFTVGYPKNNLPRLEADIKKIVVIGGTDPHYEIYVENVVEILE